MKLLMPMGGIVAVLSSCGPITQEGRLVRQDVPAMTRFYIANASATSTEAFAQLPDGTACKGRISRTDVADNAAFAPEEGNPYSDGGVGALICSSNVVLRCRLVHRYAQAYAYGECADQNGAKYMVLF